MHNLETVLKVVNEFTPTGIIALMVVVFGLFLWKNPFKGITAISDSLDQIKGNHLHQMPEIAANMERAVDILERIEVRMGEEFTFIRVKLENDDK